MPLVKGGSRGKFTPHGKYLVNTPLYLPLLGENSVKLLTTIFIIELRLSGNNGF